MKAIFKYILITIFIIFILPLIISLYYQKMVPKHDMFDNDIYINILDKENNKVIKMQLEEYVKNVVKKEMPCYFNKEALKAQSVLARTYTLRRSSLFNNSNPSHPSYEVCTDSKCCQAFLKKKDLIRDLGGECNTNILSILLLNNKIDDAVDETRNEVIFYNQKIIEPLYFSASGGVTENSEDYFDERYEYLRSVESPYEEDIYMNYKNVILKSDFKNKLKKKYPDIKFNGFNIKILSKTKGKRAKEIKVGDKIISGKEFREMFGLKSSFIVGIKEKLNSIVIYTNGFGHGVGLSQYGANGYAKKRYKYKDIIKKYYTGVYIKSIKE